MVVPELQAFPPDVPVPATFDEALRAMKYPAFLQSQKWQSQQWRAKREGAHPDILEFEKVLIRRMAGLGVPMFAHEVIRTPERQDELYALGNSRAKGGSSAHQFGMAADIVHSVKAWALSDKQWALVGHVGREVIAQKGLAIESNAWSGGRGWDPAHWQIANWKAHKEDYPWLTK